MGLILPLGGDFPGTLESQFFIRCLSTMCLALIVRDLRTEKKPDLNVFRQPVAIFALLFSLSAAGSLLSIPFDEIVVRWNQLGDSKASTILMLKETWVPYLGIRTLMVFQAFAILLVLARSATLSQREAALTISSALLFSYVWVISFGILDYFGFLSLSGLRAVATGLNEKGLPLRLQSVFGHPAWCAMYLGATAPSVMVLFACKLKIWQRNLLVVGLLIAGEYALLLTFARGGWVSYPFTLLCIWGCIYWLRGGRILSLTRHSALQLSKKAVISLPVTVAISVGFLMATESGNYHRYAERLKAISHAVDRTVYIRPSLMLASDHPILGGGTQAFAYRYTTGFVVPTGKYAAEGNPLGNTFNNAHSLYLGVLVGQGVGGLCAILAWLFAIAWACKSAVQRYSMGGDDRAGIEQPLVWVALLCSSASVAFYGVFDDTFYPPAMLVLLFIQAGLALGATHQLPLLTWKHVKRLLYIALFVMTCQFFWEYLYPAKALDLTIEPDVTGCYRSTPENVNGFSRVWCSEDARLDFQILKADSQRLAALQVTLPQKSTSKAPVFLTVSDESQGPVSQRVFKAPLGEPFWIMYPLPSNDLETEKKKLRIQVSDYVVPLRDVTIQSLDRRKLAFQVREPAQVFGRDSPEGARCVEIPVAEEGWKDFWCAGGGEIPIPSVIGSGQLDVSIRLPSLLYATASPIWVAYHLGEAPVSFLPISDLSRRVVYRNLDAPDLQTLHVEASIPSSGLRLDGERGFVVGYRVSFH
jgi:O-antigen ligase